MLNIAICDDEQLHRDYIARLCARTLRGHGAETELFPSARAMLNAMELGDWAPSIAVLDIQMEEMDGITLARRINQLAPDCQIVFITGNLGFATDVYDVEHVYFVLKDQAETRLPTALPTALAKAMARCQSMEAAAPSLVLRAHGRTALLPALQVCYIERMGKKTRVVTTAGEHSVSQSPHALLGGAAGALFLRCHQSYWVNLRHVAAMENDGFTMSDGSRVPISRAHRPAAREAFFASLREKLASLS